MNTEEIRMSVVEAHEALKKSIILGRAGYPDHAATERKMALKRLETLVSKLDAQMEKDRARRENPNPYANGHTYDRT